MQALEQRAEDRHEQRAIGEDGFGGRAEIALVHERKDLGPNVRRVMDQNLAAIDQELERLNASMLRELSSE